MGVCNCNHNKNGIVSSEMFVSAEAKNATSNNVINHSSGDTPTLTLTTTKKTVIEDDSAKKSQIQKNLIKFTYLIIHNYNL